MAGEWPLVTVGQLADSISDTHRFGKEQLVFLNTSDVLLGKILHNTYSAVSAWPGQAKKSIRRDDILFSEIRPSNGRWAYVDSRC
jgi:type I restriction enzyme S subunit